MRRPFLLGLMAGGIVLCTEAPATGILRDFSGDPMQRYESRMPDAYVGRMPSAGGISFWPLNPYYYAPPSFTVVNVEILLAPNQPSESSPPPAHPVHPKIWTNRCGTFVELNVTPTSSLIEEEQKPC